MPSLWRSRVYIASFRASPRNEGEVESQPASFAVVCEVLEFHPQLSVTNSLREA